MSELNVEKVITELITGLIAWLLKTCKCFYIKLLVKFCPNRALNVTPFNERGQNAFCKQRDADRPGKSELWMMKIHIKVHLKHLKYIHIQNISATYKIPGFLVGKTLTINNSEQKIGGAYEMKDTYKLDENNTADIFLTQKFEIPYGNADNKDYETLDVTFTVTSCHWPGEKEFIFSGKLEPGGHLIKKN